MIKSNRVIVYCSGQVAMHPETKAMVEGGIADRTVSYEKGKPCRSIKTVV